MSGRGIAARRAIAFLFLAWVTAVFIQLWGFRVLPWRWLLAPAWGVGSALVFWLILGITDSVRRATRRRRLRRNATLTGQWLNNLDHRRHESRHRR